MRFFKSGITLSLRSILLEMLWILRILSLNHHLERCFDFFEATDTKKNVLVEWMCPKWVNMLKICYFRRMISSERIFFCRHFFFVTSCVASRVDSFRSAEILYWILFSLVFVWCVWFSRELKWTQSFLLFCCSRHRAISVCELRVQCTWFIIFDANQMPSLHRSLVWTVHRGKKGNWVHA